MDEKKERKIVNKISDCLMGIPRQEAYNIICDYRKTFKRVYPLLKEQY